MHSEMSMNIIIRGVRIVKDSVNQGSDNRGCTVLQNMFLLSEYAVCDYQRML